MRGSDSRLLEREIRELKRANEILRKASTPLVRPTSLSLFTHVIVVRVPLLRPLDGGPVRDFDLGFKRGG